MSCTYAVVFALQFIGSEPRILTDMLPMEKQRCHHQRKIVEDIGPIEMTDIPFSGKKRKLIFVLKQMCASCARYNKDPEQFSLWIGEYKGILQSQMYQIAGNLRSRVPDQRDRTR